MHLQHDKQRIIQKNMTFSKKGKRMVQFVRIVQDNDIHLPFKKSQINESLHDSSDVSGGRCKRYPQLLQKSILFPLKLYISIDKTLTYAFA
jgi:hypothetical protein